MASVLYGDRVRNIELMHLFPTLVRMIGFSLGWTPLVTTGVQARLEPASKVCASPPHLTPQCSF